MKLTKNVTLTLGGKSTTVLRCCTICLANRAFPIVFWRANILPFVREFELSIKNCSTLVYAPERSVLRHKINLPIDIPYTEGVNTIRSFSIKIRR